MVPAVLPKQLSESDIQSLVMSMATVRGDRGVTVEEATTLYNQCEAHLTMAACIRLAIAGKVMLDLVDGELTAIHPLRVAERHN